MPTSSELCRVISFNQFQWLVQMAVADIARSINLYASSVPPIAWNDGRVKAHSRRSSNDTINHYFLGTKAKASQLFSLAATAITG